MSLIRKLRQNKIIYSQSTVALQEEKKNFHILALQKTPLKHHPLFWCLSCFKLPVNYLNCDMQAFLCEDCNEILKSLIGVINI